MEDKELCKYLGYVGPHRTSQQFLMMFLWLYGFWILFFPDQDPLIWTKQKGSQPPSAEQHLPKHQLHTACLLGLIKTLLLMLYLKTYFHF